MAENNTVKTQANTQAATPAKQDQGKTPLQTAKGNTTINDTVVQKLAGIAAREVPDSTSSRTRSDAGTPTVRNATTWVTSWPRSMRPPVSTGFATSERRVNTLSRSPLETSGHSSSRPAAVSSHGCCGWCPMTRVPTSCGERSPGPASTAACSG